MASPLNRFLACLTLPLALSSVAAEAQGPARPPIPVEVVNPQATRLTQAVELPGTIRAQQAITLRAPVSELVRAVHFREGQNVEAGQLLLELARADERAALSRAEAEKEDARLALKRIDELARSRAVSQAERDSARVRQLMAVAEVDAAKAALSDREIRAPFAGRLGLSEIAPGSYLNAGDAITTLHDLSTLQVEFDLPQSQLELLGPESAIHFRRPNRNPSERISAALISTASALDMQQRALRIRAQTSADANLRPGLAVVVTLQSAQRDALTVPESALVPRGGQQWVFQVSEDNSAKLIPVTTGLREDGRVEIQQGLKTTDVVVVRGADRLRPGAKVEPRSYVSP